jgi:hypothetical protein
MCAGVNMRRLCDIDDETLLQEYRESVERVNCLHPDLPRRMYEIRVTYREYLREELDRRGLSTQNGAAAKRL